MNALVRFFSRSLPLLGAVVLLWLVTSCASSESGGSGSGTPDTGWPRSFTANGITFTVYQPQLTSWDGQQLAARAVVAAQPVGTPEPTYGTVNLSATTETDKVNRQVTLYNATVSNVQFPGSPDQNVNYQGLLQSWVMTSARSIALDRLEADLAIRQAQQAAPRYPVQNNPPQFIVSYTPAVLVLVQGNPAFAAADASGFQRLLNTRALIARGPDGTLYLHLWDGFVQAPSLNGPWTVAGSVPAPVTSMQSQAVAQQAVDLMAGQKNPTTGAMPSLGSTPLPTIYVATQPASLIVFQGPPAWAPIAGTQLAYATNTVANVFQYASGSSIYVLTSGRWFTASGFAGPWSNVPNDGLPSDFSNIPTSSPKENVLASVAGTPQAQEAVIANSIPQMTRATIGSVSMDPPPIYDGGTPQWSSIAGTPLSYAANSATAVIQVSPASFFAVQNGLWFTASAPSGPWALATSVPAVIYTIPLTSPVHWVTYVRIYNATDSYVIAGYTPGYYGTVVSSAGVVVYGTGYVYDPYVGSVYIAAPVTYGYDATLAWTPWAGWGYGFAMGWAWAGGWNYWCACPPVPYWGAYSGWHYNAYGGVTAWGPGGWAGTTGNVYHNWGNWSGVSQGAAGYNAWTGRAGAEQWGHAYNSVTGTMAVGERGAVENVYNGNYATAARGAAYNPNTGLGAYGSRGTVGNADSGRSASYARGTVVNPATGQSVHAGGIQGSDGNGIYHVGNSTFASDDGNIYQHTDSGWQQYNRSSSGWNSVNDSSTRSSLDSNWARQSAGSYRADSWGGGRSWGGGGWGGGGFRGGGFGGRR